MEEKCDLSKQIEISEKVQPLSFFVDADNKIKFFDGERTTVPKIPATQRDLVLQAMQLRDNVRNVLNLKVNNCTDDKLFTAQLFLQSYYVDFVENFGRIQENKQLKKFFKDDSAYQLLRSLENFDKDGNFVGTSEIFTERTIATQEPSKMCYEQDAERQKRIDAIKNIDIEAKPKTNAEKLQRFCKKSMEAHGEGYEDYVTDGVKQFLLATPSVKLEQMTKLIDAVAPDAVCVSQVNTYSEVVKKAVREDKVFRDRLKIARAKSSGISR